MATTTVYLRPEAIGGDPDKTRLVHRSQIAAGDTLNILGLPVDRDANVKVYTSAATCSVYSSTDDEATIIAGTGNKQLWTAGAVTADAEDTLVAGHTAVLVASAADVTDVEVVA